MTTKVQAINAKINKCDYVKRKSFCAAQEQQKEEAALEWEKVFANHTSDKGLISKISLELIQFNSKKPNNIIK